MFKRLIILIGLTLLAPRLVGAENIDAPPAQAAQQRACLRALPRTVPALKYDKAGHRELDPIEQDGPFRLPALADGGHVVSLPKQVLQPPDIGALRCQVHGLLAGQDPVCGVFSFVHGFLHGG